MWGQLRENIAELDIEVDADEAEGYESRTGVWDAIESVKRNAPDADFEETSE